tara:strand:+ start:453 stop:659 length:207 start_codon:yes stop_codon:yes gene_type:complete
MNKEEINKMFFEDLYKIQKNEIHFSSVKNAKKVILELLTHVDANDRDDIPGKDEAVLNALEWLKNTQS